MKPLPSLKRLLVVEDNHEAQLLLRYLLQARFRLQFASTVDEALAAATTAPFDLFLLDINMREKRSGLDLLHSLRALPTTCHVPALALTAYALPGDRERFLEHGFDGYLSKPFVEEQLLAAIEQALSPSEDVVS